MYSETFRGGGRRTFYRDRSNYKLLNADMFALQKRKTQLVQNTYLPSKSVKSVLNFFA